MSLLSRTQLVLCRASVIASPSQEPRKNLVDHAKSAGKLTFASAGIGTASARANQSRLAGIVIVRYRGGAPALADFLSGKVDFTFGAVPTIKPHIEGGKARGLGVTRGRAPQLPDIPGMDEIGYGVGRFRKRDGA